MDEHGVVQESSLKRAQKIEAEEEELLEIQFLDCI